MFLREGVRACLVTGLLCQSVAAQMNHEAMNHEEMNMKESPLDVQLMSHQRMGNMSQMAPMNTAERFLLNFSAGTALNPAAWPMPMVMKNFRGWNTMFMGQAFVIDTQQSGPRGGDKFYSSNWLMANTAHRIGKTGAFQFQLMMSLEPATITQRRYPLLFQTGESAFGKPIVDGQHPHDLFMGMAFQYARSLGESTILQLSYSPVGDPALGPVSFPHRASALELPQATLAHHWQDSTHIANNVVTAGIAWRKVKVEASGFYGREPNENRWNIDFGAMDSWSARLWFFPTPNWAAQFSAGRLHNPEEQHPGDVVRTTASLHYSKPIAGSSWSSSVIWGRNHNVAEQRNTNSYVAETAMPIGRRNIVTGRAELVDKDELFANNHELEDRVNERYGSTFRIGAYTAGYTRDVPLFRYLQTGVGANIEFYSLPHTLKPFYGNHPLGGNVFIRVRLRSPE